MHTNRHSLFNGKQSTDGVYEKYMKTGKIQLQDTNQSHLKPRMDNLGSFKLSHEMRSLNVSTKFSKPSSGPSSSYKPLIQAYTHSAIDKALHSVEKSVSGLGKCYLTPKVLGISGVIDAYSNTQQALKKGIPTGQALTCGVIRAAAQTTSSYIGHSALWGAAGAAAVGTKGNTKAAVAIVIAGAPVVEEGSKLTGQVAEQVCRGTFRAAYKIDQINDQMQSVLRDKLSKIGQVRP